MRALITLSLSLALSLPRCVPAFWSRGCIFPHGSSGMTGYVNLVAMAAIYNAIQTPLVRCLADPCCNPSGGRYPPWLQAHVTAAATCPMCADDGLPFA